METSKKTLSVNADMIGKYLNLHLHTDVLPLGKIIGIKGKNTLILASVKFKRDESVKMNFIPGGFSGHCVNNYAQEWIYTVDENDTFKTRWSQSAMKSGKRINDQPIHFYDYNF